MWNCQRYFSLSGKGNLYLLSSLSPLDLVFGASLVRFWGTMAKDILCHMQEIREPGREQKVDQLIILIINQIIYLSIPLRAIFFIIP